MRDSSPFRVVAGLFSRTTTAEARSLIWVSETSMAEMPWASQNSLTLPWTKSSGLPRALLTTSISENLWPPLQPVPMALRKASLAANRAAKCMAGRCLDSQ